MARAGAASRLVAGAIEAEVRCRHAIARRCEVQQRL